jgi:hypothetical protein
MDWVQLVSQTVSIPYGVPVVGSLLFSNVLLYIRNTRQTARCGEATRDNEESKRKLLVQQSGHVQALKIQTQMARKLC